MRPSIAPLILLSLLLPIHPPPLNMPPPTSTAFQPHVRLCHFRHSVHATGSGAEERQQVGGDQCKRGAGGGDEEE